MQSILKYAGFASFGAAIVFSIIANANLLPGKSDPLKVLLWREKSDFTEKGWKLRQISVYCGYLALGLMVARGVVGGIEK